MVFSSILFLFRFLPIFLVLYFVAPNKKMRNLILLLGSLIFYAWGEPIYICLMLFSTVSDYVHGIYIESFIKTNKFGVARGLLISSIVINLGMLGFFKYFPFLNLALPIGISFYTFQTMSYTIDVYRGEVKAQKSFLDFATYVTMFPQLIAGPILKYKAVQNEISERHISAEQITYGIRRFVLGMGKKVLLANNIGLLWNGISSENFGEMAVATAWLGIISFAFQIYFDFSGYSDMAIGLGSILGFYFPENFNYPYISTSITEFWRRWHISLSSWFKEYVYIPLGGNRKGLKRQIVNMLIVWCLTGVWHGAGWNFLLWGLWFFLFLMLEKVFLLKILERMPKIFSWAYAMLIVLMGWVLFELPTMRAVGEYLKALFSIGGRDWINTESLYLLSNYGLLLVILVIAATPLLKWLIKDMKQTLDIPVSIYEAIEFVLLIIIFLLSIAYLVDATYNPFLYFRF